MLEIVAGFPERVLAFSVKGRLTKKDYGEVLIPTVNRALARYDKVSVYYEFGPDFTGIDAGAALADFKIGMKTLWRWERMAVVTDVEWIRIVVNVFRYLFFPVFLIFPGAARVFAMREAAEARRWIAADESVLQRQ
jgi:hypothetical protein